MVSRHTRYGQEGESIAARHLKKLGYKILERNYRNSIGEIDIIAMDRDTIVFVEVKTRRNHHFGGPKWAVTQRKQQKISMVALSYLKQPQMKDRKARFDVVAVTETDEEPAVEIIRNAFEVAYK